MADEGVVAFQTLQDVVATERQQRVVTPGAYQNIVVNASQDNVPPVEPKQNGQDVVFLRHQVASQEEVVPPVPGEEIPALLPEQQICRLVTTEKVIAGPSDQLVDALPAQEVVVPGSAQDKVVARAGAQNVPASLSVYPVVPSPAKNDIRSVGADKYVVSGPPYQGGKCAQSIHMLLLVDFLLGSG